MGYVESPVKNEQDALDVLECLESRGWRIIKERLILWNQLEAHRLLAGGGKDKHDEWVGWEAGGKAILIQTEKILLEAQTKLKEIA